MTTRRLDDSPLFWVTFGLIVGVIYVARACGWLP